MLQVNFDPDVIGDVSKIRVEHDGRQQGKGWHLDKACRLVSFAQMFYHTDTIVRKQ